MSSQSIPAQFIVTFLPYFDATFKVPQVIMMFQRCTELLPCDYLIAYLH